MRFILDHCESRMTSPSTGLKSSTSYHSPQLFSSMPLAIVLRVVIIFLTARVSVGFSLDDIQLPRGFQIRSYTNRTVPGARSLTLSQSRRHNSTIVYVSTRQASSVYAVIDLDNDGVSDRVVEVISDQWRPNGIVWRSGSLFVATVTRVLRYDRVDRLALAGRRFRRPVVIRDGFPETRSHDWRYLGISPNGKLFISIGIRCNICRSRQFGNVQDGSIMMMNPDGSDLEVFARGVRNSLGFDWHPITGDFWFTENGADNLGDNRPDDVLYRASGPGLDFGFPFCHIRGVGDPYRRFASMFRVIRDQNFGDRCQFRNQRRPVQALGPHVAALGMRFYTGQMFPRRYRNSIFIAEHGSHNRDNKIGYRVVNVKLSQNNINAANHEIFAYGWLDGRVDHGEPVDVEVLPDGSLLVSDDQRGDVYRITYQGTTNRVRN